MYCPTLCWSGDTTKDLKIAVKQFQQHKLSVQFVVSREVAVKDGGEGRELGRGAYYCRRCGGHQVQDGRGHV